MASNAKFELKVFWNKMFMGISLGYSIIFMFVAGGGGGQGTGCLGPKFSWILEQQSSWFDGVHLKVNSSFWSISDIL